MTLKKQLQLLPLIIIFAITIASAQDLREVKASRTLRSKTFYSDTQEEYLTQVSAGYIHYRDTRGEYQRIHTQIRPNPGGGGRMHRSFYSADFAGATGRGKFDVNYTLQHPINGEKKSEKDITKFQWKIHSAGIYDVKRKFYSEITGASSVNPQISGNRISYPNIFSGVELRLRCDATKLKEEFVLSQQYRDNLPDLKGYGIRPHHAMFMFAVEFNLHPYDLEVFAKKPKQKRRSIKQFASNRREDAQPYFEFEGSERINFRDKADDLQFFFDVDYAYSRADSANRQKVERVFYNKNGKNYLLVGVPYKWLMAAPEGEVVIDPTVHAATVEDTWIEDATNHGDRDRLLIGKSAGNPKKRTLIKFDLTGIPAGVELSSADLRLQYYGRGGDLNATWVDRPVSAHKILVDWHELEATTTRRVIDVAAQNVNAIDVLWNASYGQSGSDYSAIAEDTQFITPDYPRWVSWDIKALTQQWVDVPATNYGVMLLATNEDVDGFDLRFRSSDYTADTQFRPKLEVRWTLATRTTYFLKDHLGTTRAAINDAGDVVGYDDYDPWGLILANRSMASQPDMPFKYTGKEWDDDDGLNLYYFGARYYDPVVGRWNGIDPLAGKYVDLSPYNYTLNNPIALIDLDGEDVFVAFTGGAFGGGKTINPKSAGTTGQIMHAAQQYADQNSIEFSGRVIASGATSGSSVNNAIGFIQDNYSNGEKVIIYGYSYGADFAVDLAGELAELGINVELLVTVDGSDGPLQNSTVNTKIPANVNVNQNVYQTSNSGASSGSQLSGSGSINAGSSGSGSSNSPGSNGGPNSAANPQKTAVKNNNASGRGVNHGNLDEIIKQRVIDWISSTLR